MLKIFMMGICFGCFPPFNPPTQPPPPPGSQQCSYTLLENEVIDSLDDFGTLPYEIGWTYGCVQDAFDDSYAALRQFFRSSFAGTSATNDPCKVSHVTSSTAVAANGPIGYAHAHPLFTSAAEYRAGNGCLGDQSFLNQQELNLYNNSNRNFSSTDRSFARGQDRPAYIREPAGTLYRGYTKETGTWRTAPIP